MVAFLIGTSLDGGADKEIEGYSKAEEDDSTDDEKKAEDKPSVIAEINIFGYLFIDNPSFCQKAQEDRPYSYWAKEMEGALRVFVNKPDIKEVDKAFNGFLPVVFAFSVLSGSVIDDDFADTKAFPAE